MALKARYIFLQMPKDKTYGIKPELNSSNCQSLYEQDKDIIKSKIDINQNVENA